MSFPFAGTLVVSYALLLGCSPKPTREEPVTTPTATPIAPVAAVIVTGSSESPNELVQALYKTHDADRSPFFQTQDRKRIDRFFVKEMADLIWEDAVLTAQSGDVPFMDADPLYNAQDKEIKNFTIHPAQIDEDQAEVVVTFTNLDERKEFTFLLDNEKGKWLISDIFYGDGSQLFQLLSGREEETP